MDEEKDEIVKILTKVRDLERSHQVKRFYRLMKRGGSDLEIILESEMAELELEEQKENENESV